MFTKVLKLIGGFAGSCACAMGTMDAIAAIDRSKDIDPGVKGISETGIFILGSGLFWNYFDFARRCIDDLASK